MAPPTDDRDPRDDHRGRTPLSAHPIEPGPRRRRAPKGGARNASAWLTSSDPTWRESVIGSAFVGTVLSLGGAAAAVAVVLKRRRAR